MANGLIAKVVVRKGRLSSRPLQTIDGEGTCKKARHLDAGSPLLGSSINGCRIEFGYLFHRTRGGMGAGTVSLTQWGSINIQRIEGPPCLFRCGVGRLAHSSSNAQALDGSVQVTPGSSWDCL